MTTHSDLADFLAWSSPWLSEGDGLELAPYILRLVAGESLDALKEEWTENRRLPIQFSIPDDGIPPTAIGGIDD